MSIADDARAKLEGITPGPWSAEHFPWHHDDDPEWEVESHALRGRKLLRGVRGP
ncbi:hypothetical protein SEA_BEARBQ_80 [Gordonia phage BearBQ]|nr:hypothetical protein SEA_BEARBQ_80 [Gordonia phage BearBQ]